MFLGFGLLLERIFASAVLLTGGRGVKPPPCLPCKVEGGKYGPRVLRALATREQDRWCKDALRQETETLRCVRIGRFFATP